MYLTHLISVQTNESLTFVIGKEEYTNEINATNRKFCLVLKLNSKKKGAREVLKQDILNHGDIVSYLHD